MADIGGRIERLVAGVRPVDVVCGLCIMLLMHFRLMCLYIWFIWNVCIGIFEFLYRVVGRCPKLRLRMHVMFERYVCFVFYRYYFIIIAMI